MYYYFCCSLYAIGEELVRRTAYRLFILFLDTRYKDKKVVVGVCLVYTKPDANRVALVSNSGLPPYPPHSPGEAVVSTTGRGKWIPI